MAIKVIMMVAVVWRAIVTAILLVDMTKAAGRGDKIAGCIESFHSIIKREWLNRFKTRNYKQAYQLIFEYLEAFYNTKRIHSHCDYMSPNEFERVYERTHTEAELLAG